MIADEEALRSAAAKALRIKAVRLQREGDVEGAFKAYEEAVALAPQDPELLLALAELASQADLPDVAVQLWAHLSLSDPTNPVAADGYARALIDAARFSEAVDLLKSVLQIHPDKAYLWTTLGLCLTYAGRAAEALTFFDEGVRLDPRSSNGVYNRGLALCDLGRLTDAEADFRAACELARDRSERATIEFSLATTALGRGDLASGWSLYERRLSPDGPKSVTFQGSGRRMAGDSLAGRSVLVLAEQGISDEVMFAGILPDLVEEIGPEGRLILAVETRLVGLFQRSFPSIDVCAHATPRVGARPMRRTAAPVSGRVDLWTPLASLAQRYRKTIADFPRSPYLRPDPARIEHWKAWLGPGRPAFGITWRSGKIAGERQRLAPPLEQWTRLLQTPGAQFVNIQYGESASDLACLSQMSGIEIRQPPGLNIRDDLDDLAALCAALDAVVGIQNATSVLAGACGAQVVFVAGPGSWFQLGQELTPWFADARVCETADFGDWTPAIAGAEAALRRIVASAAQSGRHVAGVSGAASSLSDGHREPPPKSAPPPRRRAAKVAGAPRIMCVLRSGGDYSPAHVERLQRQLARRLPGAELTCLSDVPVPCRRIALRHDWSGVRGWWAKMELFAPWVEGDVLYFDLDTSFVGDLTEIAAVRSLTMLRDFNFGAYVSSGVMFLPEADRQQIWDTFSRDPVRWIGHYDNPDLANARWGDQGFLSDHGLAAAQRWQDVVPGQIASYKVDELARRGLPQNVRVICFHGQPRPWAPEVAAQFRGD